MGAAEITHEDEALGVAEAVPGQQPGTGPAPEALVDRVQELIARSQELIDPQARELVEELTASLMDLYGEGLARIVEALEDAGAAAGPLRRRLVEDGVVASLLLIHDLYPVELAVRVSEALDSVRPYMESHGGNVELVSLDGGIAHLRLEGSCNGCAASSATLELAIKQALDEHAPDLLGLEVEGVKEPPSRAAAPAPEPEPSGFKLPLAQAPEPQPAGLELPLKPPPELVSLSSNVLPSEQGPRPSGGPRVRMVAVDHLGDLGVGEMRPLSIEGVELLVANVDGSLLAYRDACGGCERPVSLASIEDGVLRCPACDAQFDLPRAGRGVGETSAQMNPVPLLPGAGGEVKIALPT